MGGNHGGPRYPEQLYAALSLATVRCYLRWRSGDRGIYVSAATACTLAATLLDISGPDAPAAWAVFMIMDFITGSAPRTGKAWFSTHSKLIASMVLVCAISLACTVYAYAAINWDLFLSMGQGGPGSFAWILADFIYLFNV